MLLLRLAPRVQWGRVGNECLQVTLTDAPEATDACRLETTGLDPVANGIAAHPQAFSHVSLVSTAETLDGRNGFRSRREED